MHKLLFATIIVCCSFHCIGQENNIWYFGGQSGVSFNPSPSGMLPTSLSNSAMTAAEGSASICDKSGNLLFYTNGVTIYNRNHNVMVNGDGLMGHISAVQSSVIVPLPGSTTIYYVFTTDALENDFVNGYRYSIVDMSQAGGLGAVTTKNQLLSGSCTERLMAARHADGVSVWVILNNHSSNLFQAWLMTCNGLASAPVVSIAGEVMDNDIVSNSGSMKVSPEGRYLVHTHFSLPGPASTGFAQLFDFNNSTGQISNAKILPFSGAQPIAAEFSADSKLLYLLCPFSKEIYQVENSLPTAADIVNSRVRIATPNTTFYGIQMGPDGKIYLAQTRDKLSVISKPGVKGLGCNYEVDKINLAPRTASLGLPNFINDLSVNPLNGFTYDVIDPCAGTIQFNGVATLAGSLSWSWDFGDGNTSTQQNPVHTYAINTQQYLVNLVVTSSTGCGRIERSMLVNPGGIRLLPQFSHVARCDSGFVRFTNESVIIPEDGNYTMTWDFGDGNSSGDENPVHSYAVGGTYNVTLNLTTSPACLNRSVTVPVTLDVFDIQAPADMTVEANQPVQLFVTGGGVEFAWSPATGLNDSTLSNPVALPPKSMWYKVTVVNEEGCTDSDSVFIKVNPAPGIYVPKAFTPNNDGRNDLFRPIITKEYTLQEFTIFNRWGEKLFSTSQVDAGWNGRHKGVIQETGAYVWMLRATDQRNGEKHFLRGTFVLIH